MAGLVPAIHVFRLVERNRNMHFEKKATTKRVPMWNISSGTADFLFSLSNVVLIIGAAAVLIGTIGSIKMASVREYFADLRLSENERETSKANLQAQELKASNLILEAKLAPRRIDSLKEVIIARLMEAHRGKSVGVESYQLDTEAAVLGRQILNALSLARIRRAESLMTRVGSGSIAIGIHVTGKDSDLVKALVGALKAVGSVRGGVISSRGAAIDFGQLPSELQSDANVFVGVKPIVE
jgi:hypothetical protein